MPSKKELSHVDENGRVQMVDVSGKPVVRRDAEARGKILLQAETLRLISEGGMPKGDVLATAKIAGIQAVKRTWDLIPMCHPLPVSGVEILFQLDADGVEILCRVRTDARTGVEMEALCGVSVAALTIYDMCKAVDAEMEIRDVRLTRKTKEALR